MIVVTSNWAIGDGSLAPAVGSGLGGLAAAIHRAVARASVHADGVCLPIDRLDLVLAGDTFDWLLSAEWLGGVKPWHASGAAQEAMARIVQRSLHAGRAALQHVIDWARWGLVVPVSRSGGRRGVVPVRVTMLAGDRDEAMEEMLEALRGPVSIGRRWDDGRVSIRHGHEFDPVCSPGGREAIGRRERPPTLAESVTVDLIARFGVAIGPDGRPFIRRLASSGVLGVVKEIAAWLVPPGVGSHVRIKDVWRKAVDDWWRQARLCIPAVETEFDAIDALAAWFRTASDGNGAVCPREAGLTSLVAGPVRGSVGTVFGHLEGAGGSCAPMGLAGEPRAVACRAVRGWPRWETISGGTIEPAVIAIRNPGVDVYRGVRVIDAA